MSKAQWFAPGVYYHHPASDGNPTPVRADRHYPIQVMVFPADAEEAAYEKGVDEAANDSDVNFDWPGQRNVYYTLGASQPAGVSVRGGLLNGPRGSWRLDYGN